MANSTIKTAVEKLAKDDLHGMDKQYSGNFAAANISYTFMDAGVVFSIMCFFL